MIEALRALVDEVMLALGPLVDRARDPQALVDLLADLGWTVSSVPRPLLEIAAEGAALVDTIGSADDEIALVDALAAVKRLVAAVNAIRSRPDREFPAGIDVAAFKETVGRDLLDSVLVDYLLRNRRPIGILLKLAGIIRLVETPAMGLRHPYLQRQVAWSRVGELVANPLKGFREAFDWDSVEPQLPQVLGDLAGLLESCGLRFLCFRLQDDQLSFVNASATAPIDEPLGIDLALISEATLEARVAAGVQLVLRAPTASRGLAIALLPYARLDGAQSFALSDTASLSIQGDADFTKGVAITFAPGHPVELQTGFLGGAPTSPAEIGVGLEIHPSPGEPERILLGTPDASRLAVKTIGLSTGARLISPGQVDVFAEIAFADAHVVVKPAAGEADSFLASLLGPDGISADLSFGLRLSSLTGFHLTGSGSLEASFPVNGQIGPIRLQALSIGFKPGGDGFDLEVGAGISATVGPLTVAVNRIGFSLAARFPDPPNGNLGPLDVGLGFLPPDGAGLYIDSAGVSGGGFLKFEPEKHEYSGVLQLEFNQLALQAFGLITTQVAGGQGYSLLALIDADFPPVQLGWGFTLDGVGGLLAIHRTASVDALRAALKADKLSTILFSKDAIANAPQILAALDAYFPTAPGRFLFGPMALIGWGTPTVLTAAIAVVVELPEPIRILLLARVAARLPSPAAPLVRINMDALGVLDLGQSALSLDATLFDSRLLSFVISGDMALRATWAGQREFLLAIGGFHPRFTPPAGFPALQRITIDMPSGIVSKLRLAAYLAITSNTMQFGAELDVFIGVSGFGLAGHLGFDALLQLDPFHFDADISGSVALTAGGDDLMSVGLEATLSGPAPWNIAGKFKIHLLFFDVHKSFSHSWGEDAPALDTAVVDVGQLLNTALADPRSWAAQLPAGAPAQVSVRRIEDPTAVLAHPLAQLEVHERTVPLGLDITRFGGAAPAGATRFAITGLRIGAAAVPSDPVQDDFAPAQFFELSDEEKLARPSFERHDAGVRLGAVPVASGSSVHKDIAYETFYIDELGGAQRTDPPAGLWLIDLQAIREVGSAARAASTRTANRRYQVPSNQALGSPIRVQEPAFVVVDADTLVPVGPAAGTVYSEAQALLNGELARDPGRRGALQIVATHEMAGA
jgi:hypothetical protein